MEIGSGICDSSNPEEQLRLLDHLKPKLLALGASTNMYRRSVSGTACSGCTGDVREYW